jgi:hypothetical protein
MPSETTDLIDGKDVIDTLTRQVGTWPGVETTDHRFGGVEFRVGRREIGHVHAQPRGGSFADLPFPRRVRDELIEAGRARAHHVLPDSGWLTVSIRTSSDLADAIEIFRMNFDRPWTR